MKGHIDDELDDFGTDVTEQRVIGGRLHIQSGRNLATKVMSNGVEVIVKGDQTGFIGYGYAHKTPLISPMRVSPKPITFPPSTVSRQYHLVEHPGKPNLINHLLHSIVRSATPDMVTKTLVTTFTYMTTVLENHSTVVNSREQIISNVVTEKFRPTIEYTPNLKAEPSSIPPYMLESLYSSYLTNTLRTTYSYFNTFTAGTIPIVVTSRETVSNVVTIPAYLATPTVSDLSFHSRVFETGTYYTTFTFSKTLAEENSRVVTTMETVTQVVVTEALIPMTSPVPLLTPLPQDVYSPDVTKTYLTTFTFMTTAIESGQLVVQSRTEISSEIMTEKHMTTPQLLLPQGIHTAKLDSEEGVVVTPTLAFDDDEISSSNLMEMIPLPSPTLMERETVSPLEQLVRTTTKKIMEPVLIFATKTYYTTYTYFTTVMGEGGTSIKVNSRTQVASNIVTEALSTAFDIEYVNALKSSYLAKHSTLLEITSTVKQIIPDKTESASTRTPVLVTQSVSHPHWPKDEDEMGILDATTTSSGSAEHFDEMKEGISHIVHVLSDTQSDEYEIITPSQVMDSTLYSTIVTDPENSAAVTGQYEEVTLKEPSDDYTTSSEGITEPNPIEVKLTYSSISHKPTPPLAVAAAHSKPSKNNLPTKIISNPFDDPTLSIVTGPPKSVMYDDDEIHHDHHHGSSSSVTTDSDSSDQDFDQVSLEEPIYGDMNLGDISSLVDIYVNSMYNKNQSPGSSKSVLKSSATGTDDGLTLFPSILDKFDMAHPTLSTSKVEMDDLLSSSSLGFITKVPASKIKSQIVVDPTQQIFNMLSEITADQGHLPDYYDEVKEEEAFKENYEDGALGGTKVYNISTINPTRKTSPRPPLLINRNTTTTRVTTTATSTTKTSGTKPTTITTTTTKIPFIYDKPATKEATAATSPAAPWTIKTTPQPLTTAATKLTTVSNADLNKIKIGQQSTTTRLTTPSPSSSASSNSSKATTQKPATSIIVDEDSPFVVVKQENIEEQKDHKDDKNKEVTSDDAGGAHSGTDPFTIKITSGGNLDDSEIVVTFSSKKPEPTRYTTRKPKPKITAKTTKPPSRDEVEDDDIASTTKIYALAPVRGTGTGTSTSEESVDEDQGEEADDKSEMDDSDEVADHFPSDRHPPHSLPPTGSTGPSKTTLGTALTGPVGAGNTGGSQIVSASTSGINWTPLLNLGALGLGGLGASTLTRFGPMLSSVAGYMKNALPLAAGIARNDTSHHHNRNERPYNRVPSSAPSNLENGSSGKYNHPMGPNFIRVNPGQPIPFSDSIPRRPIVSHANEPNFRPLSNNNNNNNRDPDGPFHRLENGGGGMPWVNNNFPPTHNYNFIPPNDAQPNIFSQLNVNKHGESQTSSSEQVSGPNKIKIVAGSPINAVHNNGGPPPRAPPQQQKLNHPFGLGSSSEEQDNRRPFFPRPPPRSQDGGPLPSPGGGLPWGEHVILPLPPHPSHGPKDDKENRPGQSRINFSGENHNRRPPPSNNNNFNSHESGENFNGGRPNLMLNSNEIRDNGPPKFLLHPHPQQSHTPPSQQQQNPRPAPSRSEFISKPPPPDRQTIHVVRQPTEITILSSSSRKPPPLHHMDKVYYNNMELISGNQNPLLNSNPLLTIEIENHNDDHDHDHHEHGQPSPTTKSHAVTTKFENDNNNNNGHKRLPFENSAESIEHDSFVPPPRFPPTNSLHFLPTPPPMQRPPPQQQQGPNNNNNNILRPFSSQQPPTIFGPTLPFSHFSKPPPSFQLQDHSGEQANLRPVMVQQQQQQNQNDRRPFNPNNNLGINRPFRHNPQQPTPPDGLRPMSRPHNHNHNSEENMSHVPESSEHDIQINRPPPPHIGSSPNQNPLFPNQRNPHPDRHNNNNNNNGMMIQHPFNRPSQNRFPPGMMGNNNNNNHPMMSFNNRPNSLENIRPQVFNFPPPQNSMELHHQQQQNQMFIRPFNQRPSASHEHGSQVRPPLLPPPPHSHEFGNFAQPQRKKPILIPGFPNNSNPWKSVGPTSQENSQQQHSNEQKQQQSSLENHRPAPSPSSPTSSQQQRPSTIFIVHESYDVPTKGTTTTTTEATTTKKTDSTISTTPRDSFRRRPSTQKLIIKEIPSTTTPKTSTTSKTMNKATISKLNFIRRFTTPVTTPRTTTTTTTTTSKPTPSTTTSKLSGFIVSPTVGDVLKFNNSNKNQIQNNNNRFGGKLPTVLSPNNNHNYKIPTLTKFAFQSTTPTTRKPFDASKHFKNVATGDPNFGQDFSGSEDAEHIIDPVNEQVIKSPFDNIHPTSFKYFNSTAPTSASTTTRLTTTTDKSSSVMPREPSSSEEQKILNSFAVPDGFLLSTPNEFNDLWWPTTFKPKPTMASVDKNLANHRHTISSTPKGSLDDVAGAAATTFRNTVKPTTFRPNGGKASNNNNNNNRSPLQRNQLRRPLNEPSIVNTFYDDDVGIGEIKIKNVEIHKDPAFVRRPGHKIPPLSDFDTDSFEQSGEKQAQRRPSPSPSPSRPEYSEEISEEVKELEKIRRPLTSSQESIIFEKGVKASSSSVEEVHDNNKNKNNHKNNQHDDNDDDDIYDLEKLPYPSTRLRPPAPPPHYNLDPASPPARPPQLTAQQKQQQQPHSNRPGPLETISNIFRRPVNGIGPQGRPQQGQQRPDFHPQSPPLQSMMPPPPQQNLAILQNPPGRLRPFPPPPHPPGRRPLGPNNILINRNPILVRQPPIRGNNGDMNNNNKQSGQDLKKPVGTNIIRPPRPQLIPVQQQSQNVNLGTRPTKPSPLRTTTTKTVTKRPESSQEEYSDEFENDSNEIIIDNVRSSSTTPKEGDLIIQNQQKSPEPPTPTEQVSTEDQEKSKEEVASSIPKPMVSDQVPAAAGDQQDGSEEYYEEDEDDNEGSLESKKQNSVAQQKQKQQQQAAKFPLNPPQPPPAGPPNRPIHAGGYISNNFQQRPGLRRPGFNPQQQQHQQGGQRPSFVFEGGRLPLVPPGIKTEMEPPPPNPVRQQGQGTINRPRHPPLAENSNNNNGRPIRFRPQGGRPNNNLRPNLLRPDAGLFKSRQPAVQPQVTLHTIASVDDDNKIVATNVFTAILSSRDIMRSRFHNHLSSSSGSEIQPSEMLHEAENILITPTTTLEGSEGGSGVVTSSSSIVKYSSGSLQTVSSHPVVASEHDEHNEEEEEEEETEESDEDTIRPIPSRTLSRSIVRTVLRSTVVRTRGGASSITPTLSPQSVSIIESVKPSVVLPSKVLNKLSPTSTTTSGGDVKTTTTSINRFVLPTRRPFPNRPSPTTVSTTTDADEENEVTEASSSPGRKPFIPTLNSRNQTYSGFPPWSRRSTTTTTTTTTENEVTEPTPSNTIRPFNFNNSTRKYINRRPFGTSTTTPSTTKAFNEEFHNATGTKDSERDLQNNSLMKATTFRPFRRPGGFLNALMTTTTPKSTAASDTAEDKDKDKDTSENRRVVVVNKSPTVLESSGVNTNSESQNGHHRHEAEEEENEDENVTVDVKSSVHVQINPTRVLQRGHNKPRNTGLSSMRSKIMLSPSSGREPLTTRFVTFTETLTRTITETESTVVSASSGQPMTHTIMITKTLPPQTLISTIVGTVTVVNSVELKPTTVRTTIYAEPTIIIPSFTDTTEQSRKDEDEPLFENVLQGNVKPGGRGRHKGRLPSSTPTASLTTETSVTSNNNHDPSNRKKNGRPIINPPDFECISSCGYKGNQVCRRYANGTRSRCVCKPGYARMKNSIPCKPTYTYEMSIALSHMEGMTFDFKDLNNQASDEYQTFVTVTKDALDKAFLSTDVKSKYQGAEVMMVRPRHVKNEKRNTTDSQVGVDFLVQLSLNVTEDIIKTQLIRQLKTSNFSVGRGTGITSTKTMSDFIARDFNECSNSDYNDCSQDALCINVKGSFSCQCRPGFIDRSKKDLPGRECRVLEGCAECNYHGKCVVDSFGNAGCNCFRWYGGAECQINLKVLLISIIVIGLVLFIMVLLCGIIVCRRQKPVVRERTGSGRFLRYRSPTSQATLERTAIMQNDSCSSEGSQTPPVRPPHHHQSFTPDSLLMENHDKGMPRSSRDNVNLMNFSLRNVVMDQDRSLTVVIPRAKIRPTSRPPSRPNQSTAVGPDTSADLAASEQKLISYLDQGAFPVPHKSGRATASSSRQSTVRQEGQGKSFRKLSLQEQRKISTGALVSSGTEVSAQGGMRRRSTGLPIHDGDSTFRGSISEVRSFDETERSNMPKQTYSTDQTSRATSCYSCKPPSYCGFSESHGHTMAEKDGASTVYTTQGKLFRMSNDSDSNSLSD